MVKRQNILLPRIELGTVSQGSSVMHGQTLALFALSFTAVRFEHILNLQSTGMLLHLAVGTKHGLSEAQNEAHQG